ncbi:trinucleotide repeat-containing gene 6C protein isoform X2 [Engraulis encrasicolus]|uniref:trinucleotide repeat-containing gene 6C protein isoform X2 n=1 Tax=Engraulis encrasicolus TaxID=184585 RepID=UPI002FD708E4
MEEKKKKKQEEKKKKDAAQKKAAEQKTKVPESAKPGGPAPLPPTSPPGPPSSGTSGNGKRAPSSSSSSVSSSSTCLSSATQQQTQTQQQQQSQQQQQQQSAGPRYPPREVPPRFRQHEHKQLLKRGQPLPPGTLPLASVALTNQSTQGQSVSSSTQQPSSSSVAQQQTPAAASSKGQPELPPQSAQGAQYENPLWGHLHTNRSATTTTNAPLNPSSLGANGGGAAAAANAAGGGAGSGWDQLIIDESDTEAWPSISRRESHPSAVCPAPSDCLLDSSSSGGSSSTNMASGPAHTGHFAANHPKAGGPGGQGGVNRGWGPNPGQGPCSDGKGDGGMPMGGRNQPSWGSPSPSFNLNLNPSANPSAWPVLGHEGPGPGGGSSGMGGTNPPPVAGNLHGPSAAAAAAAAACVNPNQGANGNHPGSGSGSAWGGMMPPTDGPDSHHHHHHHHHSSPSTNVSFSSSSEPQNLNTDGPNHGRQQQQQQQQQQEASSPVHGLPGWGSGSVGQPMAGGGNGGGTGGSQVNGADGSVWGHGDSNKSGPSSKDSGWESAASGWGRGGGGGGGGSSAAGTSGWGQPSSSGDWGKPSGEAKGWDSVGSPSQEQQMGGWGQGGGGGTPASEGSVDSQDTGSHRDGHSRKEPVPLVPAQDLDPRVLCNTGWGQTPVRQHTSWETEEAARAGNKNDSSGTEMWGGSSSSATSAAPQHNANAGPASMSESAGKSRHDSSVASNSGWGAPMPNPNQHGGSGWGEPPGNKKPSNGPNGGGWGNPPQQQGGGGGGGPGSNMPKNGPSSWGSEEKSPSWGDNNPNNKAKPQGWGDGPKASHGGWGKGGGGGGGDGSPSGDWGDPGDGKKRSPTNSTWDGDGGGGGDRGGGGGGGGGGGWGKDNWGKPAPAAGGGPGMAGGGGGGGGSGWGEPQRPSGPAQGWNSKPQESSNGSSGGGPGPGPGGRVGSWGGPNAVKQPGSGSGSGWGGGDGGERGGERRAGNGGGLKQARPGEPTGWGAPSPPSIRRKMEIDDGTSAWGDPTSYNKSVNLWDRNNPGVQGKNAPPGGNNVSGSVTNSNSSSSSMGSGNNNNNPPPSVNPQLLHHPHHGPPPPSMPNMSHNHNHNHSHGHGHGPGNNNNNGSSNDGGGGGGPHQPGPPHSRAPLMSQGKRGWGEMSNVHSKPEPSWGEPAPPPTTVDNGTSAWGKPQGSCGGWGDNGPEAYKRGNPPPGPAPCKPAPKSMQDGWGGGGEEMDISRSQWESEDGGDMWNNAASQESNSSCNSWGNAPKKMPPPKVKVPNKPDDGWIMNRLIKQLTDMGFPRDPAEEALKSNNMNLDQAMSALLEKKGELDKRGMGLADYNNGLLAKQMGCRPPLISKDNSSDRGALCDKDGGLVDDPQTSPFLPSPALKLPLANPAMPGQGLGIAMPNLNNRQMQSGMFVSSGAAQAARALQQQQQQQQQQQLPPPQPSVPPLASSQPSLRAQVPQFLSPQVQAQLLQFAAKNIGLNPALLTSPINPQHMTLLNQLYQLQLAYQRLQIQQQMLQAQRNVSGPIRQQEQQVARTINNMQQQIQQHQRQLAQALLMKQQQQQQQPPPAQPPAHPGLHPGAGKSALDNFPGQPQAPGLPMADLQQTKESQSSANSFGPYSLPGLNPNMNVDCMEVGMAGLSLKEPPQPQSRLSQWTHPNSMDLSPGSSPTEPSLSKHGAITAAPSLGPPGKALDDSYSPYSLMGGSDSPTSPLVGHESWAPTKTANDKISNGTTVSWPPEFCPGVPWKGLQNIDPENDPNMTPGSVPSGPTINTNIQDVNRYLLRDRSGGKLPDMKSTWSPGPISHPQPSLSHELWKVPQGHRSTGAAPTRPPPGLSNLSNPSKPSSTWGGNSLGLAQGWSNSYTSGTMQGTTWSTDSSNRTSSWLVLRNLTPQIDGSTLRTLCMQHGPLITFHLNLTQGNAVVRYSSKEEAAKAQKSLHMCVLGNTTILAEFAGEEEVNRFFAQGQTHTPPTTSWQASQPSANQARMGVAGGSSHSGLDHWGSGGTASGMAMGVPVGGGVGAGSAGKAGGGELLWGGVPQYSSLWGPPGGEDGRVVGSPTPINTLLPGDLLSGESM